ncbi:acetylglutamate kinase [Streptococcus saliviloxodontae]|uniref:Acetylglutamate kinase n=1 Tax=Streptococcus saliviloxodontae TaxID=1349416 RepID=A0ABS2PMD1_9STRE|nr:acetylglutamate kinase [Streptococcus saliviloxodontae]MBM7636588.1 acetylglutamate kinase [Streptococcus saliviloxodontae]
MSQVIVIKIGGIAGQSLAPDVVATLQKWQVAGHRLVVVHGGGFAISDVLEKAGHETVKCDGLRVTAKEDMPLIVEALVDRVGKSLAEKLDEAGLAIHQLTLEQLQLVEATFLDKAKYGYVGSVTSIDQSLLQGLLVEGKIPLLASLAYSPSGEILNVNADYLAKSVAIALKADRLVLMTDVKGVMEDGQVLAQLLTKEIQGKIASGVITGGMIPKIESAAETVEAGVGQVVIGDNLETGTIISKE